MAQVSRKLIVYKAIKKKNGDITLLTNRGIIVTREKKKKK